MIVNYTNQNLPNFPNEKVKADTTSLFFNKNRLSEFPSCISQLANLTLLNLSDNRIRQLPSNIILPAIRTLFLNNNLLENFPSNFCLPSLTNLAFANNHISTLPVEMRSLTNLKGLRIENNPIENPENLPDKFYTKQKLS